MFVLRSFISFTVTFLLLLPLYQTVKAQEPAKLISTMNAGGSSNTLTIDSRKYYYQQSIGQSGIIGLSGRGNDIMLRQGFIQPMAAPESALLAGTLNADIYPNPFSSYIILSFPEEISDAVYVTLSDLNGRIVYLKKFTSSGEINLDLSGLACSIYIMRVNTTTRSFYSKVIKLRN